MQPRFTHGCEMIPDISKLGSNSGNLSEVSKFSASIKPGLN